MRILFLTLCCLIPIAIDRHVEFEALHISFIQTNQAELAIAENLCPYLQVQVIVYYRYEKIYLAAEHDDTITNNRNHVKIV